MSTMNMMMPPRGWFFVFSFVLYFCSVAPGLAERDFFQYNRYPGPNLVPGVEWYGVDQEGEALPEVYERRVVSWWPREGVHTYPVRDDMPLRTWTLINSDAFDDLTERFEAHLIGFRGIGNPIDNPYTGETHEPAVVLRMEGGLKRTFVRGSFSAGDVEWIMDLYMKEMARLMAGIDDTSYGTRPQTVEEFPATAEPGEPGALRLESEHFAFISGSEEDGERGRWIDGKHPAKAERWRHGTLVVAEHFWALNEYVGRLMPYWDREELYRYEGLVGQTIKDGFATVGGGAGGGYGRCTAGMFGPWPGGLFHEWGHGDVVGHKYRQPHGEVYCQFQQLMTSPVHLNVYNNVRNPWANAMFGAYNSNLFFLLLAEDPNWGYGWLTGLPKGVDETTAWMTIARVGEQRGLFDSGAGIRGVGDMVGEYAARSAEFDGELQYVLRQNEGAVRRSWLEPVDPDKGLYRGAREEMPEAFGINIVPLEAEDGASEITVDFQGRHDPGSFSDWRACIVAVGEDGRCRYTPLWNKGEMTMERRGGDKRYWLTVAATPTALLPTGFQFGGRGGVRYPYEVRLIGARPRPITDLPENCKRHPNGGGWVASSAEVAASAYVGPNAIVRDRAKVLENAVVEDQAVISQNAVVSGNARVSGQAVVAGDAKLSGYARIWHPTKETIDITGEQDHGREDGLLVHYAMAQPENVLLEDLFRREASAFDFHAVNFDGDLVGNPDYVAEGGNAGYRFDGESQYAEISPRAADLGEITVAIELKWEGQGGQVLLDFGSGPGDRMMLTTAGDAGGGPVLVAWVGGDEVLRLTAREPLPRNEWVRLRIEIDGESAALWIDGEQVARVESSFRAAHAFKPGEPKRNFLGSMREGTNKFKGVFGKAAIYHKVHGGAFDYIGAPVVKAPLKPKMEFLHWSRQQRTIAPSEAEDRKRAAIEVHHRYLNTIGAKAVTRLYELRNRNEEWVQAVQEARHWHGQSEGERDQSQAQIVKRLQDAAARAEAPYLQEVNALHMFINQISDGYYNHHYFGEAPRYYGGKFSDPAAAFDIDAAWKSIQEFDAKNWYTKVGQWDWRTEWEVGQTPNRLTEKWINRVRGEVVLESPVAEAAGSDRLLAGYEELKQRIEDLKQGKAELEGEDASVIDQEIQRLEEEADEAMDAVRGEVEQRIEAIEAQLAPIRREVEAKARQEAQRLGLDEMIARLEQEVEALEERVKPEELMDRYRLRFANVLDHFDAARGEIGFIHNLYGNSGWWRMRRRKPAMMGEANQYIRDSLPHFRLMLESEPYRVLHEQKEELKWLKRKENYLQDLYFVRDTDGLFLEKEIMELKAGLGN